MNTTWHSEKPPRCYGAICAALVVSTSMGQVARRCAKAVRGAYTLRVTPTCWHHDFVIVTAGSDLATLAALCIYCTQRLCHDAVKYQYGTRTPVSPGAAQQQAADFGALDLREVHGAAVARGQP